MFNEDRKEPKMKRSKRRLQRQEKRHQAAIKKHELGVRIRELRVNFIDGLGLALAAHTVSNLVSLRHSPRGLREKKHRKLSLEERQELYFWRSLGLGIREIARRLRRAASTVSRELKRNKPVGRLLGLCSYSRAKLAHDLAQKRRCKSRRRIRFGSFQTQGLVFQAIYDGLSPELVSGRLLLEHGIRLSHEAIYRWIYDLERVLIQHLPRKGKRYRRGGKKRSRAKRKNQTPKLSIEKRPAAANDRLEFGHWEVDCIVSRESGCCLLVLQERLSRFFFVAKLPNCTAKEASHAIIQLLDSFERDWLKSLTCDNGAEFWDFDVVSLALEIPVYFCHPYCASERGGVENRNGMLREFFPKKTDFELITDKQLEAAEKSLRNRPMRCLEYFTPQEIFTETFQPLLQMAA